MLVILLYVAVAVLVRLIPIIFLARNLVGNGIPRADALERASAIVNEDPVFSTLVVGILSGVLGLLIVWFLVRGIEKSNFTWKMVGLDWKRNSVLSILLGAGLAFLLFLAYILAGRVLGSTDFSLLSPGLDISAWGFFQKFILCLAMGFGEEIVFRGYVQTRLVERYRAIWGILITAVIFVLLHQISYSLSPILILSGVMLWTAIGILYHLSQSLYLVVMLHGLMNTLWNVMGFEFGDTSGMIVNALALFLVIVFVLVRPRISGRRSNPI
jgi:membrane protease YdiL (CAAX protease family)